jgi:Big-like domain-containing protein
MIPGMLRTAFRRCGLAGLVTVTLSAGGGSSSSTTPTTPAAQTTVTAVAISGAASLTIAGQANQLTATATLSDGTTQDVTRSAAWHSSNVAVATISTTGLVTAMAAGTTTITGRSTVRGPTSTSLYTDSPE